MKSVSKRILGIHLGLILAEALCVSAFVIEVHRARQGNTLSWAYVFEWPIFAVYAVYLWRKLLHEEREPTVPRVAPTSDEDAAALKAYNEYLDQIHGNSKEETDDSWRQGSD